MVEHAFFFEEVAKIGRFSWIISVTERYQQVHYKMHLFYIHVYTIYIINNIDIYMCVSYVCIYTENLHSVLWFFIHTHTHT